MPILVASKLTSTIQVQRTKRKNVTLRLDPTLIERLDKRAEEMGESTRTGLIENILVDALDNPGPNSSSQDVDLQGPLEIENPDSGNEDDDDLTPEQQELFDVGFDVGKEEGLEEAKRNAIIELHEELAKRPDPHSCEFLGYH